MKPIMIAACMLFTLACQAQLMPGKKAFQKKWVKDETYEMTWYAVRDTAKMELARVITSIRTSRKAILIITQVDMKAATASWVDSTSAKKKTLKPIRHSSRNGQRDMVLDFGPSVTGFYNDKLKKKSLAISDTVSGGYFDSNIYPSLLRWLPLADGYRQEIAVYDYNPAAKSGVLKASVDEVRSGTYESAKLGKREVWILKVSDEIGGGNSTSTYYIDKADRKLWKQEITAGNRKMLMQAVE